MQSDALEELIAVAAGRKPANIVIRHGLIADVYSGAFIEGDIALCGKRIAGIGSYDGDVTIDARGMYILPGLIDSHIHIESSFLCPEELSRLLVPHGTTTIIADPHEMVNVAGLTGLDYMLAASEKAALDIKFMLPSCVPAAPFENAGAVLDAQAMIAPLGLQRILGLGEFMDVQGVISAEHGVLMKLLAAYHAGKLVDGHSPGLAGKDLNAYIAARVHTDHECETIDDVQARIMRGMYVMLRQGSACRDLRNLAGCVTPYNERRCLLCSDDRQPKTIAEEGHIDGHLRICVEEGIAPMIAIRMATLNAAECFRLHDRGAIAPGLRADLTLVSDLKNFTVKKTFVGGTLAAEDGICLLDTPRHDYRAVRACFNIKNFSKERLRLPLKKDEVYVIEVTGGSVVTGKARARVKRGNGGEFQYDAARGIVKIAVIERHKNTGNVGLGLLRGYGLREGAIALSIGHDSHNLMVIGADDDDMAFAVEELVGQSGGVIVVKDRAVRARMPLPLGGLMSDRDGNWVTDRLAEIESAAGALGVKPDCDPVLTLCFMSLAVIPDLKITDTGLYDVRAQKFIPLEVE